MAKATEKRRCGCPEQYAGRWCTACHGTGEIPPSEHTPDRLCPPSCHSYDYRMAWGEAVRGKRTKVERAMWKRILKSPDESEAQKEVAAGWLAGDRYARGVQ